MSFLGGSPSTPAVTPVPAAPTQTDAEVQAAKDAEAKILRDRQGRGSTILTGAQGVLEPAQTQKKTLLGQ
jgi:hypothetical protein